MSYRCKEKKRNGKESGRMTRAEQREMAAPLPWRSSSTHASSVRESPRRGLLISHLDLLLRSGDCSQLMRTGGCGRARRNTCTRCIPPTHSGSNSPPPHLSTGRPQNGCDIIRERGCAVPCGICPSIKLLPRTRTAASRDLVSGQASPGCLAS